jgi:hypothetical protein
MWSWSGMKVAMLVGCVMGFFGGWIAGAPNWATVMAGPLLGLLLSIHYQVEQLCNQVDEIRRRLDLTSGD